MENKEEKPKNEFEEISEETPEQTFSGTPDGDSENMIASGQAGQVYDWTQAPEGVKAPPRVDLDGKELIIEKVEIIIPSKTKEWIKARSGKSEYKMCTFALHYNFEGQQEFYSGVRTFKRDEKDSEGFNKCSHPTIMKDRKNQASQLLGLYADYKKKDINEVSLREFMNFLNSKPKVRIKVVDVINPTNEAIVKKNMVGEFLPEGK